MNDLLLQNKVKDAAMKAPSELWLRIQKEVATQIATDLLNKLDTTKEPKKRESIDRTNEAISDIKYQLEMLRGA